MNILLQLFWSFAKIGAIAYGGGPAMIPVIENEVVNNQGWVTDADFRTALGIGYSLPGPISPQMAFWTGWRVAGFPGGLVAWLALELPSMTMMMILSVFFWRNMDSNSYLAGAAKGASVGVVGLMIYLAVSNSTKVFAPLKEQGWASGLLAHPDWVVLVIVVVVLSLWRPNLMVPVCMVGSILYGALFLR